MPALEIRKLKQGHGMCETCLVEKGPSRSGMFQVFLCGHPADFVCGVHRQMWLDLFEPPTSREKAA